jgi:hypothetical protein
MRPNEFPIPLGTAWVIVSGSMTLLVTARHCLNPPNTGFEAIENHLFVVKNIIYNDDGTINFDDDIIPVRAVSGDPVADIAVLKANIVFPQGIALCPRDEYPTVDNEDRVKTYHVPCQSFPHETSILACRATEYSKILFESRHHFYLSGEHMHGSSGGAVVDTQGRAVGLICSGYIPGITLPLPDSFQTVWETITALSNGTGTYTRCVKFNVVPTMYTFFGEN